MARNRREIDSGRKRDEIVAAARCLFLAEGYDATAMARIAAEAGVAPNTLYWYFTDKDELLIAVLDELVAGAMADYAQVHTQPLEMQLIWMLEKFDAAPSLVATVHARLAVAPAIRNWHERFHRMLETLIVVQLAQRGVPEQAREVSARIAMFVVEGLLSHHAGDPADRITITTHLVAQLASPSNQYMA